MVVVSHDVVMSTIFGLQRICGMSIVVGEQLSCFRQDEDDGQGHADEGEQHLRALRFDDI